LCHSAQDPPKVQFLTTGGGRERLNPNLYACGKVCLSLLGTWPGHSKAEKWAAGTSSMLQVTGHSS
jgi:ubiquitin-protein ligase